MFLKNLIKQIVGKYNSLHYLYIIFNIGKFKVKNYFRLKSIGVKYEDIRTLRRLIEEVLPAVKLKNSKVANVIGSGWSLLDSYKSIRDNHFVIGFNFAALINLKFDIYFFEFCSNKQSKFSKKQLMLVETHLLHQGGKVYFKNIWEDKNDIECISKNIKGKFPILIDYVVPCLHETKIRQSLKYCLDSKLSELPQYGSTAFTSIFVAYFLGFKQIVLHGIDFHGYHFYHLNEFEGDRRYILDDDDFINPQVAGSINKIHATSIGKIGIKAALPILRDLLKERGVDLYAASNKSPSSEILPLYIHKENLN